MSALGLEIERDPDFEVLEDNWQPLQVFLNCATQWRYAGMDGHLVGIDYSALQAVLSMMQVEDVSAVFQSVQLIEQGALKQLAKEKNKESGNG